MDNMGPSWTLRVYHGHLWVHHPDTIGLSWTLESIMATMRLWVHQGHYSYIMDTMSLSWTLWVHNGHYGSIMVHGHYGSIMDTMDTLWALWVYHGQYGSIMDVTGPSWTLMGSS
jgi:hypothetical protein